MRYLSLFSGIEAASIAWEPLGWTPVAFAEVEPFPCALLAHRFPNVPNLGDVTKADKGDQDTLVAHPSAAAVRRLTPTECERLQGFPDGWTAIPFRGKPAADGPRYKSLGNSMAVPVIVYVGRRIEDAAKAGEK